MVDGDSDADTDVVAKLRGAVVKSRAKSSAKSGEDVPRSFPHQGTGLARTGSFLATLFPQMPL